MNTAKIPISIDHSLLEKIDHFVAKKKFKSRSQTIQIAVSETLNRLEHSHLIQECAKLDPAFEQQMADEDLHEKIKEWPDF